MDELEWYILQLEIMRVMEPISLNNYKDDDDETTVTTTTSTTNMTILEFMRSLIRKNK